MLLKEVCIHWLVGGDDDPRSAWWLDESIKMDSEILLQHTIVPNLSK